MLNETTHLIIRTSIGINNLKDRFVTRLERGDADSGGSTLRTLGVVTLVVLVVAAIGLAILFKGKEAEGAITNARSAFPW